jgi:acyl-CoA hydrolase/ribosomal protein S18 acetylase RimI-like enzyme
VAAATREAVAEGRADYTPINLVDIPQLFRSGAMPIDFALIQVSPPGEHGFCSYGIAVDIVKAATESAGCVIAQVNPLMPVTHGDTFIHVEEIDAFVEFEEPLLEMAHPLMNPIAEAIGRNVAKIVENGSTIRAGVGSIPSAALYALDVKKDLGVHTDMLTDPYLHLIRKGVITNACKTLHPGKIVASFCLGSQELYDFVDDNPMAAFYPIEYTNDHLVISQNEKMITLNSALEVDLTGQVCSDSLGYEIYSGVGGSVDFLRGARNSIGGKAIVVLPSTTLDGKHSRIVPSLAPGAGVVTTRGGVQYVVTEYGVAQLHGKSIRERTQALISIAHPDFREELMEAAQHLRYLRRRTVGLPSLQSAYPAEWEVSQIFEEGTEVFFRPVKPTDESAVQDFFHSLPRNESYVRFLSRIKVYPHHDFQRIVNIDYYREMAVIGLIEEMSSERIVALGGYVLDEESMTAEVDFAVHPDYGRKGIASFLVQRLTEIARSKCIEMFTAYVTTGNERVFGVFQKLGYVTESSFENGLYEIRIHFRQAAKVCLT